MAKHTDDEVSFALDQKPAETSKDAEGVKLSVRVEGGKLQVCTGVRSGTGTGPILGDGGVFMPVNAPFKLARV
jgi:hypothetical protein